MNDLHAAVSLYTHGVISRTELRQIASVYYQVALDKDSQPSVSIPFVTATSPTPPVNWTITTTAPSATSIEERPTKCACNH